MFSSIFARGSSDAIVFGASDVAVKASTHQFGSRTVPARPFLPVTPDGQVSMEQGPAMTWYERLMKRIVTYVEGK